MPNIDYAYIDNLNTRLSTIIKTIDNATHIKKEKIDEFCNNNIYSIYRKLKDANIIQRLNNQGRRPEEVYYNWMRGYVTSSYFLNSLGKVFEVNIEHIKFIGDDDITNIETFKRTPKADLSVKLPNGNLMMVEIQSGFQGINDIKQHKILEARKIKLSEGASSLIIHFDLFNGQAAFIKADEIEEDSVNWITRQQMEGQTVFNIDQNSFIWKLTDQPPKYSDIV
jgi:hypothetical protein